MAEERLFDEHGLPVTGRARPAWLDSVRTPHPFETCTADAPRALNLLWERRLATMSQVLLLVKAEDLTP